jgi:hypothetical protein
MDLRVSVGWKPEGKEEEGEGSWGSTRCRRCRGLLMGLLGGAVD